eukprot:gene68-3464_t
MSTISSIKSSALIGVVPVQLCRFSVFIYVPANLVDIRLITVDRHGDRRTLLMTARYSARGQFQSSNLPFPKFTYRALYRFYELLHLLLPPKL